MTAPLDVAARLTEEQIAKMLELAKWLCSESTRWDENDDHDPYEAGGTAIRMLLTAYTRSEQRREEAEKQLDYRERARRLLAQQMEQIGATLPPDILAKTVEKLAHRLIESDLELSAQFAKADALVEVERLRTEKS